VCCFSFVLAILILKACTKCATLQHNRALSPLGIDMQFIQHHLNLDKLLLLCGKHSSGYTVITLFQCFALAARTAVMTGAVL
jgi:hypothetical protein